MNNFINISIDQEIIFDSLIKQLLSLGYQRTSIVREKSDFSIRGSIIDIYLVDSDNPIRIDFLGNKIESINPTVIPMNSKPNFFIETEDDIELYISDNN